MRAGLAALSVIFWPVLAVPVPSLSVLAVPALMASASPAHAQCAVGEPGTRPAAAGPPFHALAAPFAQPPATGDPPHTATSPDPDASPPLPPASRSHAAMLGATPRMAMRTDALTTQMPAPLASRPTPYQPYQSHTARSVPLTSEEVAPSLRARGFVDVSAVRQRGRSFLAEATGPRGERVRLVLDAESGEISGMQVIGFNTAP